MANYLTMACYDYIIILYDFSFWFPSYILCESTAKGYIIVEKRKDSGKKTKF